MDPPRGAGGVREFTNYGSLRLAEEGCSQQGESGRFSGTPSQTPPDMGKANSDGVFFHFSLLELHVAAEIGGSKGAPFVEAFSVSRNDFPATSDLGDSGS